MNNGYQIKTKNIKSIVGYTFLLIALSFYMSFLFQYMPVVMYILGIITFVVFGLYLIEDWFNISKKLMLKIIGISYVVVPIAYKVFYFLKEICVGKDIIDITFGGLFFIIVVVFFSWILISMFKD